MAQTTQPLFKYTTACFSCMVCTKIHIKTKIQFIMLLGCHGNRNFTVHFILKSYCIQ